MDSGIHRCRVESGSASHYLISGQACQSGKAHPIWLSGLSRTFPLPLPHLAVGMVLDVVLRSAGQQLGDLHPSTQSHDMRRTRDELHASRESNTYCTRNTQTDRKPTGCQASAELRREWSLPLPSKGPPPCPGERGSAGTSNARGPETLTRRDSIAQR